MNGVSECSYTITVSKYSNITHSTFQVQGVCAPKVFTREQKRLSQALSRQCDVDTCELYNQS